MNTTSPNTFTGQVLQSDEVAVKKLVYETHAEILATVELLLASNTNPVAVVNFLLQWWLKAEPNLKDKADLDTLDAAMKLVNVLFELMRQIKFLEYYGEQNGEGGQTDAV